MTKLIAVLIIVAVLFGGWQIFLYWDKVNHEEEMAQKQAATSVVDPRSLQGLPYKFQPALEAAQKQGAPGLTNFLKNFNRIVQDPRRAWIELDYCVLIARENPAEAKRIFAAVKGRTPPSSPVMSRIKQLEKTYE
jgi:hypothetical protein